jgi:predicted amidohydrolase
MSSSTNDDGDGPSYRALSLQIDCRSVTSCGDRSTAREEMARVIERISRAVAGSLAWTGSDTRLVVLPEYVLTGFPTHETIAEWRDKAAPEPGGAEYEALGRIAADHRIHLAGNAYESDPNFPDLYFQTSFILGPDGSLLLRYRRLNSMFSPTPHDVWSRYLDIYGLEAVFPVVETPIGRLAAVASEEILYPEIARCMAMRGAEVIVHSSCETASPIEPPKAVARRARALENLIYVVSCNTAGLTGIDLPADSSNGGSAIVDFRGRVLAQAGQGESVVACAEIDLAALRRFRRRPGMENLLSRQRFEAVAESYREARFYPADNLDGTAPTREHFRDTQRRTIAGLIERKIV